MTVVHGSCFRYSAELAAGDLMVCDPPYSPNVHRDATSVNAPEEEGGRGVVHRDLGFAPLSYLLQKYLAWLASKQRRWALIFSDFEGLAPPVEPDKDEATGPVGWLAALHAQAVEHVRVMPWLRWTQPQLCGDRPAQGGEAIIVCHRMQVGPNGGRKPVKKHWNGAGGTVSYDARCLRGSAKCTAEKPIDLMLSIVSDFSDRQELIVDPTSGHGTTALACRLLGRRFFGCEENETRAAVAAKREASPMGMGDRLRIEEWFETRREDLRRTRLAHEPGSPAMRRFVSRARDVLLIEKQLVKGQDP